MQPGTRYLIKCTRCDTYVIRQELSSGNSFDAVEWTDGRVDLPMMPRCYDLPYWYCPDCRTFHRTSDLILIDKREVLYPPGRRSHDQKWESAPEMQEPGWRQYLDGISQWEKKLEPYPDWETEIRMLAWRRYNDRFRQKLRKMNEEKYEQEAGAFSSGLRQLDRIEVPHVSEMIENCNDAANWLYERNPDKGMDKADLLRWLGRYELSLQLLDIVKGLTEFDPEYHLPRHNLLVELSRDRDPSLGLVGSV